MGVTRSAFALVFAPLLLAPLLVAAPAAAVNVTASQMLAGLVTAMPSTSLYDRAKFQHWIDADGNGCDTRQEVLIAESTTPVVKGSGCTIVSGTWYSWYDDATWTDPSDVDVDHMVPLSEAWRSGADVWTSTQRRDYANDLTLTVALEAVTDNVNQSKGDKDPGSWMPPASGVQCQYATDWVLVKYKWNLTIDTSEKSALQGILSGACGDRSVVTVQKADTPPAGSGTHRLAGANRYETAVEISRQYEPGVSVVYVADGRNYPDALSAAPAAARQGGPLLLTPSTGLPNKVRDEIQRLRPSLIVLVGGTGVMPNSIYSALSMLAPEIRRDGGANRYETSRIVIDRAFPAGTTKAFFATGTNFPDALSASAAAGSTASPVFLVNGLAKTVDSATAALIQKLGVNNGVVAGGTGVVSTQMELSLRAQPGMQSVVRYAGANRYETSREINRHSFTSAPQVFFAVGTGFADALAGAALAGRDAAPLYVVPKGCVPGNVVDDVVSFGPTSRVLLGGTGVLGSGVETLTRCATAPPKPPASGPKNPGDTKNCSDFSSWSAAQAWYLKYFPVYGDVARLDADHDGIACESLPGAP